MIFVISATAGEINLSAAMSLKDVITDLSKTFSEKNPNIKFRINLGASGAIAKQVAGGAPADMFISANIKWMTFLKEKTLIDDKYSRIFAYNVLVFVGKPGLNVKTIQDILKLDRIAIGSPGSVPAGEYAMQALNKAGIENKLKNKLVMAKDVRSCLLYADNGEVDGSFVYKTDAVVMAKNSKILFTVSQDMYPRVTYPMALTVSGSRNHEAVEFFKYLQTKNAKDILIIHGFLLE